MLYYGDYPRDVAPQAALEQLGRDLGAARDMTPGINRHQALVAAFIDAGELAQGLVDAEFVAHAEDRLTPLGQAASALLLDLARDVVASWDSGFTADPVCGTDAMAKLAALPLPELVQCNRAEGFAFYALYPELYAKAAATLPAGRPHTVIGIRSIGLALAAIVAARTSAAKVVSVRPMGHPFARTLALSSAIDDKLGDPRQDYAIVDEGPGLSGSSFAAVLDRLAAHRVPEAQVHVFPSHSGEPGRQAGEANLARWARIDRQVASFEDVILSNELPRRRLAAWFADLGVDPATPLDDLSGGLWRQRKFCSEAEWPAANLWGERRKYLLAAKDGPVLLKFAGLGRYGQEAVRRADVLAEGGFTPAVLAWRHGFSASRWLDDARPLRRGEPLPDGFFAQLTSYLGFRARALPAARGAGASLAALAAMLQFNAAKGLGIAEADLDRFVSDAECLQDLVRPVQTDNMLKPWEWLRTPKGELLKTDAVDHCAGHDLVGCQDIAWDVAGAAAEFELNDAATEDLAARIELAAKSSVSRSLLAFMRPCYLAFQLGAASMARDAMAGVPGEAARMQSEVDFYAMRLRRELEQN